MQKFIPDYNNIIDAALNRPPKRLPLYEHMISGKVIEKITGEDYQAVAISDETKYQDRVEAFRKCCDFCIKFGYDVVPFECCVTRYIQQGEGLRGHGHSIINDVKDVEIFDWDALVNDYIRDNGPKFNALAEALPLGMKAIGGIGNGVFEAFQDFTTYTGLCMLQYDQPEAFDLLWRKIGDSLVRIWQWFINNHADAFAVCRFGDDLGFKSSTLIAPDDICKYILPQYKRIVNIVHTAQKPFLLHSCGKIYDVMNDIIDYVGINAKHSNEDSIDTFDVWLNRYGERIGNFGGIEMNMLCMNTPEEVAEYVENICRISEGHGGVAIGSGNQIADYVKPECFVAMTETVRKYRGDF
jgi:uroporphyrinogen decarboxylase